ncbi:type VI secretion system lipoprotein TssJ [Erwinia sp. E602]|uniref:type VI secretion system lipoprotein TssJ n=1 Tax=unclassified Erwinia TaxID=2622719 RepID=UPI0007000030|nr:MULTISPECIES: type VI secretion system lipoprotein TssJ [unclassified Erwinia]KQN53036.1 type VI secretion protein [Erwinia sp. Leaf53]QUG76090.1 type VI secretion system lipoprotein TssJ [Erwinia sp. E602]
MLTISLTNFARWLLPLLAVTLNGCGLTQSVADGTRSAVSAVFCKKIKVLHLDFIAREALNTDTRESHTRPQSVVIRVYQLKDRRAFDRLVYPQLATGGDTLLAEDLPASRDVVLTPGGAVSLNMPMEPQARFVAVVGLFRQPDLTGNGWKQVLDREALDPDTARVLEASENSLTLLPLKDR